MKQKDYHIVISNLLSRIKNNSFIKSVLTLSAGVVVSQAIALFTMPIVSRIYTPEIIGDFSIIVSSATIIGVFVTLGLMPAIMIPKADDESKGICRVLTYSICGLTSLVCIVAICISGYWKLFEVDMPYWLACLFLWVYVVLTNVSSVGYAYLNRQKLYKVLFWNPTIGTATNAVVSIGLGLLGCGLWGYLCGNLLSMMLVILHMLRRANPFSGGISREYAGFKLLKKHKDFPLVLLPSEFCGTVARQIPVQMISRYWGSFILGSYSMCLTILGLPTKFLAGPVNRVFYREAAERMNRGENIGDFTFRLLKANIKLALIPIIILIVFGPQLFSFVLGEKWLTAGALASVLGVSQLMAFCNSCLSGKFVIINKKKTILALNIVLLIIYPLVFCACHYLSMGYYNSILVYAIISAFLSIVDTFIFICQAKVSVFAYLKFLFLYLLMPVLLATAFRIIMF